MFCICFKKSKNVFDFFFFLSRLFIFRRAGRLLLRRRFSGCGARWRLPWFGARASRGGGSCCRARAPGPTGSGSRGVWPPRLRRLGPGAQAGELRGMGFGACRIFLDQGWDWCLLPWQAGSLPLSHQESPPNAYLYSANVFEWLLSSVLF